MSRFLTCAALFLTASLISASLLSAQEVSKQAPDEPPGMQTLFNGSDLSGWDGDSRMWLVQDGVIRGETTEQVPANGNTFLIWKEGTLQDFDLRMSFRCTEVNNSGIQYRSRHITDGNVRNPWVVRGYQYEIRNEETFPNVSGFIYDEGGSRKRICLVGEQATWEADGKRVIRDDLIDQDEFKELMRIDDWNEVVIIAKGNQIRQYLNGRLLMDFTDNHPELALREGILALQLHAGKPMWAEFKDIRLKKLD